MNQTELLDLARNFFEEMRIPTHFLDAPYEWRDEYDLGLRRSILKENFHTASAFFQPETDFHSKNQIYVITDLFHCRYLCIPVHHEGNKRVLLIGPFSTEEITFRFVHTLSDTLRIPDIHFEFLSQYYSSLPILRDKNCLRSILVCLCSRLYGSNYEILAQTYTEAPPLEYESISSTANQQVIKTLEFRYETEQKIMNAISRGDYNTAKTTFTNKGFTDVPQRFNDTIRDKKNYLIVFNTLCRKAAQYGGVHPFYLDELSSRFAVQIENMHNVSKLNSMLGEMIYKYCLLVQNHSPQDYSPLVQKAVDFICLNIQNSINLSQIADFLSVNKCYLSSVFKRETGSTVTEYITERRIRHALYLLNTTDDPIQEIAIACGIPDLSYFTKIFRQNRGMTPCQYRKTIKRDMTVK